MKKLFTLFTALCCIIVLSAETIERVKIGNLYYNLDTDVQTAELTSGDFGEYSDNVIIPASVRYNDIDYSVTAIGDNAFGYCIDLTSVSIPNSVTNIGGTVFYNCSSLTSIIVDADNPQYCGVDGVLFTKDMQSILTCPATKEGEYSIPNSVKYISDGAFYYCSKLTSVIIPESVTAIGEDSFSDCTDLTSVAIGNSVITIGNSAFRNCTGLTSGIIPSSVTSIGQAAFMSCTGLISITIPESVISIDEYAFYQVSNIIYSGTAEGSPWGAKCVNGVVDGSFVFTDNTKTILASCSHAATGEIIIPNTVDSIGNYAFYECTDISSVSIPESVTAIANSAFVGCTGITSFIITDAVTSIGDYAFSGCTGLTSITIPKSVVSMGSGALNNCNNLTSIVWNAKKCTISSSWYDTPFYGIRENITSFVFGDEVESIPSYLCYEMNHLPSVIVPKSVIEIGYNAFWYVQNVIYHGTAEGSPWGAKCVNGFVDGSFLFGDETKTELKLCLSAEGEVVIPSTVTKIGDKAFASCTGMTSVIIPNSVTEIGERAFYDCRGLSTVTLPKSVTSLGNKVFYGCTGLTSIEVASDNPNYCSVDGILFNKEQSKLIQCPIKKSGAFTIPDGVTTIGESAFFFCTALTSIHIPNSVTTIKTDAFDYCMGLKSLVIPNSVTAMEGSPFSFCQAMTDVTLGDGVTEIAPSAFSQCAGLAHITIGKNVARIGGEAFDGCGGLKQIISYATTPPEMNGNVFWRANISECTLYVLNASLDLYKEADIWKNIPTILPLAAQESDAEELIAEPTDNSVVIEWPKHDEAAIYTIIIKKGNDTICTLEFDEQGMMLSIAYAAPARNGKGRQAPAAIQTTSGWRYTINGLETNTDYEYIVIVKRSDNTEAYKQTVPFKTQDHATGLDQITNDQSPVTNKIIKDNQLLILRDGKTYTVTGQRL